MSRLSGAYHGYLHQDAVTAYAFAAWASGANGTLLRTVNGGELWTKLPAPTGAEKLDFRDIDAFSIASRTR